MWSWIQLFATQVRAVKFHSKHEPPNAITNKFFIFRCSSLLHQAHWSLHSTLMGDVSWVGCPSSCDAQLLIQLPDLLLCLQTVQIIPFEGVLIPLSLIIPHLTHLWVPLSCDQHSCRSTNDGDAERATNWEHDKDHHRGGILLPDAREARTSNMLSVTLWCCCCCCCYNIIHCKSNHSHLSISA